MLSAAEAKAESLGVAYNIAVVDADSHLIAFVRQEGALIGSIELAINKALTVRESQAGKVVTVGGGVPIVLSGIVVGAVGASAGSIEQDIAVAEAAASALAESR